jgi:hypothetical protein
MEGLYAPGASDGRKVKTSVGSHEGVFAKWATAREAFVALLIRIAMIWSSLGLFVAARRLPNASASRGAAFRG